MKEKVTDFRAFTLKHNGLANRLVTEVKLSRAFDPANPPMSAFAQYETTALWDTGATRSVVTEATAHALGLVSVGKAIVNHAGGSSSHNTYLINFYLPNSVCVAGVLASECPDIAGSFGAIVGMDIILKGDFSLTNYNGQTWMTFRVPSIQAVDYVVEAHKIAYAGVGRNDPCPCGKKDASGKPIKYKHCHGAIS
jgi:hypothetical protein